MKALTELRRLATERAPGPPSTFTEFHLAKAVEIIGIKVTGRARLSNELGLGEGAARTLINRMTEEGLVTSSRAGVRLTRSGFAILRELRHNFPKGTVVPRSSVTVGSHNFGILVRNGRRKVRSGIEQRDAAVRVGAVGAVTLLLTDGRLYVPPMSEFQAKDWDKTAKKILDLFNPKDSDAIVICGAKTAQKAEEGARAAAWTLADS